MDTKELRKGFGTAAGRKAQLGAYHGALVAAANEIDRLREALTVEDEDEANHPNDLDVVVLKSARYWQLREAEETNEALRELAMEVRKHDSGRLAVMALRAMKMTPNAELTVRSGEAA